MSARYLKFGQVVAGTSATQTVQVTNTGQLPGRVDQVSMSVPFASLGSPFTISSDGCTGVTLAPGQSCLIALRFSPMTAGQFGGAMVLYDQGLSNPQRIASFDGSAVLVATLAARRTQPLAGVLTRGVRATADCSAACSITVLAQLLAAGGHETVLGTARAVLTRSGIARLWVLIGAHKHKLAKLKRARIALQTTIEATTMSTQLQTSQLQIRLAQQIVVLTAPRR